MLSYYKHFITNGNSSSFCDVCTTSPTDHASKIDAECVREFILRLVLEKDFYVVIKSSPSSIDTINSWSQVTLTRDILFLTPVWLRLQL
jgi:hypothetical protein